MIQKIHKITINYLHRYGIYQDSYIRKVQNTIKKDYSIPFREIDNIRYAQISPFRVCEISFSNDIATDMVSVFEDSDDYDTEEINENQVGIIKIEVIEDRVIEKRVGEIDLRSRKVHIDFVYQDDGESLQASPTTKKTLNLIEEYFAIKRQ